MTLRSLLQDMKDTHDVTYEHSVRCGNYLALFAKECGKDDETVQLYREAGYAHDAGKMLAMKYIKSDVNKATLSDKERKAFEIGLKSHVLLARGILKNIPHCPQIYLDAAEYHHCYYNDKNKGYSAIKERKEANENPTKSSIPEVAQMLAIVDVYDALTDSRREYKAKFSDEKVREIMEDDNLKGHFNPKLYSVFTQKVLPRIQSMPNERKTLVIIKEKDENRGMRSAYMKEKSVHNTNVAYAIKSREEQRKTPRFSGSIGAIKMR